MEKAITKGLTKLDKNLYINKNTGEIFTVHGDWLITSIGSIAGTELFHRFDESFGTKYGNKTRKEIAQIIINNYKQ